VKILGVLYGWCFSRIRFSLIGHHRNDDATGIPCYLTISDLAAFEHQEEEEEEEEK